MKTLFLASIACISFHLCTAQKFQHQFFAGTNISAAEMDFTPIYRPDAKARLKNAKAGFQLGYNSQLRLYKSLSLTGGLTFSRHLLAFNRGQINNSPTPIPFPIFERHQINRLSVPLGLKYAFTVNNPVNIFLEAGGNLALVNTSNREADFYIAGPTGEEKLTYKKKETIKFNRDENFAGIGFFFGLGTEFRISKVNAFSSLRFNQDLSNMKFHHLQNIEDEGFFYAKMRSISLSVGIIL